MSMKPAANTSASVPESPIQPTKKTGAFSGKLGQLKSAAIAIALGLTSSAAAAPVTINGAPNSTISAPIHISGLAGEATTLVGEQNSYLLDGNRRHLDVALSALTLDLNSLDVGDGGFLTITGKLKASTSMNFDIASNPGVGYAGLNYQLIQKVTWGNNTNSMTQIGDSLDSGSRPNPGGLDFTTGEAWIGTKDFTVTLPISAAGTYYLGNEFTRTETSGGATFEGFTINYTAIPEPSSALLVGGALGAALLRRRREDKNSQ